MKRSDTPTDYILLKAYTESEWDSCDFVIVHITDAWKKKMIERCETVKAIKDDSSLFYICYWDRPEGFYKNTDEEETSTLLAALEDWCFVEATNDELKALPVPETRLDRHHLKIDIQGMLWFTARAKHSGEEYYSADVDIAELITQASIGA